LSFLLDTCVISEASKTRESPAVRDWLARQMPSSLYLSVLTIGELYYGTRSRGDGKRRRELETWITILREDFDGRVLAFDENVAIQWGQLRVQYVNATIVDSQIAATALAHGLTLVTRNVRDFDFQGLAVFNPWAK
jgi:predicted nucleic acid-binding protein